MAPRQQLQDLLVQLLGTDKVYFQPPASVQIIYPCIVYKRDSVDTKFADDTHYIRKQRYQVTIIDRDPDSDIPNRVADLPLCGFSQHFVTENLNHDVYSLYF